METNAVLDAMATTRAMRYLKPDPVPAELLDTIIHAATRASSPANTQQWDFVIVQDADQRARIAKAGADARARAAAAAPATPTPPPYAAEMNPSLARTLKGARNLIESFAQIPVLIFVCVRNVYPANAPDEQFMWSAGFAASQNLIVAARSVGLGTVFTTLHLSMQTELREILGLPDDVYIATTIPLGWPDRDFGPMTRKPIEEVIHHDRW